MSNLPEAKSIDELLLKAIAEGTKDGLPEARSRLQTYLRYIAMNINGNYDQIEKAVNEYLDANPVTAGATKEQAEQIQQNTTTIGELKRDIDGKASSSHTHTKSQITDFPTSLPANGGDSDTVNGHTVKSDVPADAKFTDTVYDDSSLSSKVTQNTNDISELKTTDNVLSSRIDTLTSLTEGSTPGDAELLDIRVKADGTTATSAGNAVREQFDELKSDLVDINSLFNWGKDKTNILKNYKPVAGYYVDYATGSAGALSYFQYYQINVNVGESYKLNKSGIHIAFFSQFYDGTTVEYYVGGLLSENLVPFNVPDNAKYMTVSVEINKDNWLGYSDVDYKDTTTIKKDCIPKDNIIVVGGDDGTYTNIVRAVKECDENTTIIVRSGTYDLEAQFKEVYGNDFFVNYNGYIADSNFEISGLYLKKGVKLIADSGVVLSFMYSGNNSKVSEEFSPINMTLDNVVDGLIIEVNSNVRYHIHDDFAFMAFMNVNNYGKNEIRNCIFKGNQSAGSAIGGGMGTYCKYLIHDNYFENTIGNAISYHNASFSNAQNFIDIFNNYAETPIKLWWYGDSTKITTALVHNNRASQIECTKIPNYDAPNENIKMKAWNNNII